MQARAKAIHPMIIGIGVVFKKIRLDEVIIARSLSRPLLCGFLRQMLTRHRPEGGPAIKIAINHGLRVELECRLEIGTASKGRSDKAARGHVPGCNLAVRACGVAL